MKAQGPKGYGKMDSEYWKKPDGPSDATFDKLQFRTKMRMDGCAWNNQFAFPWEVGMYWNLTVGGDNFRAQGES